MIGLFPSGSRTITIGDPSIGATPSVSAGGAPLTFLVKDDFSTAEASLLGIPRQVSGGTGTLTRVQNDGSIGADGAFTAQSTPSQNDQYLIGGSQTRAAGVAHLVKITSSDFANLPATPAGFVSGTTNPETTAQSGMFRIKGTGSRLNILVGSTDMDNESSWFTNSEEHSFAVVTRDSGYFFLIKAATKWPEWSLLWVDNSRTDDPIYPLWAGYTLVGTLGTFRVAQLDSPFATDYGIATDRLAGTVTPEATFTHEADCIIEWTNDVQASSGSYGIRFRIQDSSNYWRAYWHQNGTFTLAEIVGGSGTSRGTFAGSTGRVVVVAEGTTIKVYEDNVQQITYASATNFATETSGQVDPAATAAEISNVVAYPRTLSGAAVTELDGAFA